MSKTLVIGIAGGTGSGKTTLMKNLISQFGGNVTVLSHDNYYRRHDELTYEERCQINYDEPAALETELMAVHLDKLRHGEAIDCPVYDFTQHNRSNDTVHHVNRTVGQLGQALVVSHDDECLPQAVAQIEEQLMQFLLVLGIQTS